MSFLWNLLVIVSFYLAITTTQNSNTLYVVEKFSKDNRSFKELTCKSADDDAALTWNYDLNEDDGSDRFNNFVPPKPSTPNFTEYAIWRSHQHSVSWAERNGWTLVNSLVKPMGPVVDYRWEGFREFILNNVTGERRYQNVLQSNSLDGSFVFSVRGTRNVQINLCENDDPTKSSCLLIKIAVGGTHSIIETCLSDEPGYGQHTKSRHCEQIDSIEHKTALLAASEWRTFRLQWISEEKSIKLFNDMAEKAFLHGRVRQWHSIGNIFVTSETPARIKFHFYEYYLATIENAVLSTAKFDHRDENFCADMLVGLCPECQLSVSLTNNENDGAIASTNVSGDDDFDSKGLRTWRSIKLNMTLQIAVPTSLQLQIKSVSNKDNRDDTWWAIDKLRICQETGGVRESTVMVPISTLTNNVPKIKCQKLLYNKIVVADSSISKPSNNIRRLKRLVRKRRKPCPPGCTIFRKVKSDSFGCRCYRGLNEKNDETCFYLLPEEKNIEFNRLPNSEMCPAIQGDYTMKVWKESPENILSTSLCPGLICKSARPLTPDTIYTVQVKSKNGDIWLQKEIKTLQSAPGKIHNLSLESHSDYVVGNWKPPPDESRSIRNYFVKIQRIAFLGCKDPEKESPADSETNKTVLGTTANLTGLHPYAEYEFTVIANTDQPGPPHSKRFETKPSAIPTWKISNLRFDQKNGNGKPHFKWDVPKNCTTTTGPVNTTKLIFTDCGDRAKNWSFWDQTTYLNYTLVKEKLSPGIQCKLRAYVIKDYYAKEDPNNYQELNFRTAPAAPPAVQNLTIYGADAAKNTISVRWKPPFPSNGEIESYQLSLRKQNSIIENRPVEISQLKKCMPFHVCLENLLVQSNISTDAELELQIFARNKNVSKAGEKTSHKFKLDNLYNKAPSQPEGLRAITDGKENVTLKWGHNPFSPTKLVLFRIGLESLNDSSTTKPSMMNESTMRPVGDEQSSYVHNLKLANNTEYRVRITALNYHNRPSTALTKVISVFGGVAAANGNELQIERNGAMIELKVPTVSNFTKNTTARVMVKGLSLCETKSSENVSLSTEKIKTPTLLTVTEEYQVKNNKTVKFKFYKDRPYGKEQDCFFQHEETYEFIAVFKKFGKELIFLKSHPFMFANQNSSGKTSMTWLISILIIVICVLLLILFWYRKEGRIWWQSRRSCAPLLVRTISCSHNSPSTGIGMIPRVENCYVVSPQENNPKPCDPHFDPIRVEKLEEYIKEALASGLLESQWKMLSGPGGSLKSCEYGSLPENMPKNQRNGAIPYDDNRVILEKITEDPHSDYINASYIQGYRKAKAYIATQGPKRDNSTNTDTIPDFWRMVWQEDVRVICMLTNVVEDGQRKCEQYWPEVSKNVEYGDSFVLNLDHQVFADYTIRTLQLMCREGRREIKHFHYTGWPEHGVPVFTQSFASFMRKLLATPVGKGPMVVHGSAGVGRTGTLILCDICLRQAVIERVIDIPTVTLGIRRDRANMVDTVQQYLFAHLVIAECKILERTQVPCTAQWKEKIEELRKQLPSDVQRLREIVWQDRALHSLATKPFINDDTASNKLLQPEQKNPSQVELATSSSRDSQRGFSVTNIEDIQREKQYLATRLPSCSILPDLWSFVADKKIELIILLQRPEAEDPTKCDIAPPEPGVHVLCHIEVETKSILEDEEYFTTKKLLLTDTSQEEPMVQPVTILTCTTWVDEMNGTLPPVDSLVSLWVASEKVHRKEVPTLVICRDGVTGCGLYLALSFLLERMSLESVCDVITAVRGIQRSEPNFVQSLDQFEFLYDAAINYNQRFDTYANFS